MPPASLVTLPNEILLIICEELCSHCFNLTTDPNDKCCNSYLSSLMRTCRRLRDIAQPFLYHRIWPGDNLLFLRTIIERPDLAAQVRSFFYDEAYQRNALDEEVEMLQAEARRLNISGSDKWVRQWVRKMKIYGVEGDQRLLKLTLARLPNAERLSIVVPFFQETTCLKDSFNKCIVMESIRRLSLCPGDSFDLGLLGGFLTSLPCLEHLEVYDCGSVTKRLPLAGLRTLILKKSFIDATSLQRIVNSCPELEHFEYYLMPDDWTSSLDQETLSWGQAQRRLHSRRKTLKHLNFVFGKHFPSYLGEPLEPGDYLGSFHDFDRLETLWVRTTSFGRDDEDATVPTFPKDVQDLVGMLPESLTCLGFCGSHKDWDGIETLVEAIMEGHFPNLEMVMLEQEKEEFEYACELLAEVGVLCGFLNDTLYDSFPYCFHGEFIEEE